MAVTPFQLTEPFSMDSFNSRISEINTMFGGLGNEYVWEKSTVTESLDLGTGSTETNTGTGAAVSGGWFIYSDDPVKVYKDTGDKITSSSSSSKTNIQNAIRGKYFRTDGMASNYISFAPTSATLSVSGSYWNINSVTSYYNVTFTVTKTVNGYVNSPDPNAYPPSVSDGYTYTPLGQMGAKVQIATGSYTGTGTYGSSNPNSLTFDFEPKLIMVSGTDADIYHRLIIPFMGYGFSFVSDFTSKANMSACGVATMFSGNTVSWYNTSGAGYQFNDKLKYNYCAIG